MIWVSSDFHLGHSAILRFQPTRNFSTIEEMDQVLIDNINEVVGRKDTLWFLGDFCWRAGRAGHFRARLKVRQIHAVYGNHDSSSLRHHMSSCDYMAFPKISGYNFHMSHYPLVSWRKREHNGLCLYGHSHGMGVDRTSEGTLDVGIDNAFKLLGEFRPFSIEEVFQILGGKLT